MTKQNPLDELLAIAGKHHPQADFGFLADSIYSQSLTDQEQQDYIRLIGIARSQQSQNPKYEPSYYHLLHLYVL
jgi:hypothetical protein